MRIAFVSDAVYPWNVGGIETLEGIESRALAKGHEVHFFSSKWPGMKEEFVADGVRFHASHEVTKEKFYRHGRRSIREAVIFSLGLLRLFKYRFDFIQANEFPILHLPLLKLYCKLYGCKLILDVAEVWDKDYWTSYLGFIAGNLAHAYSTAFIKIADAYIACSSVTAAKLVERGVSGSKVHTFAPVIDDRLMKSIKKVDGRDIIFYGRMVKEKRLDRWLNIVKSVSKMKSHLSALLVGEGPEEAMIRRRIKTLGLGRIVEFRGFYSENEKRLLFGRVKGAGLLLHMSEREGLGIVALESIALGTPVVLPDYSPMPDEVKGMCIVESESRMPGKIVEILKGRKSDYIKNSQNMKAFTVSSIESFYFNLFAGMRKQHPAKSG